MYIDLKMLRKTLNKYPQYSRKRIYGPDLISMSRHGSSRRYMETFLRSGGADAVDVVSWHYYYCNGAIATVDQFQDPSVLDAFKEELEVAVKTMRQPSQNLPLALTETGSCYKGGAKNISDRFVAGFLWLDKLGLSAQYNISAVHRQGFYGGETYALITYDETSKDLFPNPDFYISVLYKRLVQGSVLKALVSGDTRHIRMYAHCARSDVYRYPPGAIVLYYVNLQTRRLSLTLTQFDGLDLHLFLLTPGNDGLTSKFVKLNGKTLQMQGSWVPIMSAKIQRGNIRIREKSYGFIVVPDANFEDCI